MRWINKILRWIFGTNSRAVLTCVLLDKDLYTEDYNLFVSVYNKWCIGEFNKIYPLTHKNIGVFLEIIINHFYEKENMAWDFHSFELDNTVVVDDYDKMRYMKSNLFSNISTHEGAGLKYDYYFLNNSIKGFLKQYNKHLDDT